MSYAKVVDAIFSRLGRIMLVLLAVLLHLIFIAGCQTTTWPEPTTPVARSEPLIVSMRYRPSNETDCDLPGMEEAESEYALATELEAECCEACVDHYYQAIALTWPYVELCATNGMVSRFERAEEIYRASCSKLLMTAQQFGRLELPNGLWVSTGLGKQWVPVQMHGFVWPPDAFNRLIAVGDYEAEEAICTYRYDGLGVPFVVQRLRCQREPLHRQTQAFAATAIVRPTCQESHGNGGLTVELFDPNRIEHVQVGESTCPLYRDLTAPFEYAAQTRPQEWIRGFLQPGATENDSGLFMLEPYQPGKVPVVFVHGLLSEPTTWIAMANELSARPDLMSRVQLWGFEYPTGQPFLRSAADLREQLSQAQRQLDPERTDKALQQMVLIGHSMGGLLSKLQVTDSQDILWSSAANRPLSEIVATDETRLQLARSFFFTPLPQVKRVIYIGTPHRGSALARRTVGRVGSYLVEEPEELEERYRQLIDANPCVFSDEMERRVPTSVDLMMPNSDLLQAMDRLPRSSTVHFHSIIGTGRTMLLEGPADGVVPVDSARQSGVSTELFVDKTHTELHRSSEAIREVICILNRHLDDSSMDREAVRIETSIRLSTASAEGAY